VTDVPDPPRFLNVDAIYHDSVMLTWKPPLNDGGGFITQYIVEKLEQGMANWIRCCTTRSVPETAFSLSDACLRVPTDFPPLKKNYWNPVTNLFYDRRRVLDQLLPYLNKVTNWL